MEAIERFRGGRTVLSHNARVAAFAAAVTLKLSSEQPVGAHSFITRFITNEYSEEVRLTTFFFTV